jgi:D-glycero-alpha-D-manno-heptose-7-phosphate kinase
MIITRTPLRISFIGGGTDFPQYYKDFTGTAVSSTIDKYIYITANPRFDSDIRISYSKTEIVKNIDQIQHTRFKEALRIAGIDHGIELTSIGDIPAGTGLGSSSSFSVGLLNALYAYKKDYQTPESLVSKACHLEIDVLREPIGKQDQCAAAYGGLRRYRFNQDGSINVSSRREDFLTWKFFQSLLVFYLDGQRNAAVILKDQSDNITSNYKYLSRIHDLAEEFWKSFIILDIQGLGQIIHEGWMLKKQLAKNISNSWIDECYDKAISAGAIGGKLAGAGGCGFLVLICDLSKQNQVIKALNNFRKVDVNFEPKGSKIIYASDVPGYPTCSKI